LVYNDGKEGFVLDKLNTAFAFNLESSQSLRQVNLDDNSSDEGQYEEDEISDADPDNPYDYRHYLPPKEKPVSTPSPVKTAPTPNRTSAKTVPSTHRPSTLASEVPRQEEVSPTPTKTQRGKPASRSAPRKKQETIELDSSESEKAPPKQKKKPSKKKKYESEDEDDDSDGGIRIENEDGTLYKKKSYAPDIHVEEPSSGSLKPKGAPISLRSATHSANHSPMGLGIKLNRAGNRRGYQSDSDSSSDEDAAQRTSALKAPASQHGGGRGGEDAFSDSDVDLHSAPLNIGPPVLEAPSASTSTVVKPQDPNLLRITTPSAMGEYSEEEFELELEQAFADQDMEEVQPNEHSATAPPPTRRYPIQEESEESEED
jgi:hypothetical protein